MAKRDFGRFVAVGFVDAKCETAGLVLRFPDQYCPSGQQEFSFAELKENSSDKSHWPQHDKDLMKQALDSVEPAL